jgi:urea transporter
MNSNEAPTYAAAMAKVLEMVWPGLIIVTVIGCLSAWVVWRWQRKYFRPATRAWCTFAFLVGPPGVLAYWLEMHRTKLEACGECQKTVPRDRDACAACATPFPAPSLVGTEIFA